MTERGAQREGEECRRREAGEQGGRGSAERGGE